MKVNMQSKIALAMISRQLHDPDPVLRFLENAHKFGHSIDRVIIAHFAPLHESTLRAIEQHAQVETVNAFDDETLRNQLRSIGMQEEFIDNLLVDPYQPCRDLAPYGAYRTAAVIKAALEGIDHLLFFDDDIFPKVLLSMDKGNPEWEEIDFVGSHLATLSKPEVVATTSDYSGYYIIPPMSFQGLRDLLNGLGKEHAIEFIENCESHNCLLLGSASPKYTFETNKLLGGNLGLDLNNLQSLVPFFSMTYEFNDHCYLGRGEDTLLGHSISLTGSIAMDIDLRVYHNTYGDFPRLPDIGEALVVSRLYWACMGWIGRNPFLTWYKSKHFSGEESFDEKIARQHEGLKVGGELAARHLGDERFATLPDAFEASLNELPTTIRQYEQLLQGWSNLVRIMGKSPLIDERDSKDDQFSLAS
jgi:hypothetical protein